MQTGVGRYQYGTICDKNNEVEIVGVKNLVEIRE